MANTGTLTGVIRDPNGALLSGAAVVFRLMGPGGAHFTDNNDLITRSQVSATSNGSGVVSVTLARNDKITPSGTYWRVTCAVAELSKGVELEADTADFIELGDVEPAPGEPNSAQSWITQPVLTWDDTTRLTNYLQLVAGDNITFTDDTVANTRTVDATDTGGGVLTLAELQAALAAAVSNAVIDVGAATFTITTALSDSLDVGVTGVKLNLHPGTVLLYQGAIADAQALVFEDRGLFIGNERRIEHFGGKVTKNEGYNAYGPPYLDYVPAFTQAYASDNVRAYRIAMKSGGYGLDAGSAFDDVNNTQVTVRCDEAGTYFFNETLHMHGSMNIRCADMSQTILQWVDGFAPGEGVLQSTLNLATGGTFELTWYGYSLLGILSPNHGLVAGQRIRFKNASGALPKPLLEDEDYYVFLTGSNRTGSDSDKHTFALQRHWEYSPQTPILWNDSGTTALNTGTGTVELWEMERFGIVVHQNLGNGGHNTTHMVALGSFYISGGYANGNPNFSGLYWGCAQNSSIDRLSVIYGERAILTNNQSGGCHIRALWLIPQNYGNRPRPALQIDNSGSNQFEYVSCVQKSYTGTDINGYLVPNILTASSSGNWFGTIIFEQEPSGLKLEAATATYVGSITAFHDRQSSHVQGAWPCMVERSIASIAGNLITIDNGAGYSATSSGITITATGNDFLTGDPVYFSALTGSSLSANTTYYVYRASANTGNTFSLSYEQGGGPIPLSEFGSNISSATIKLGHGYTPGCRVQFRVEDTDTLDTNLDALTDYVVVADGLTPSAFKVSAKEGFKVAASVADNNFTCLSYLHSFAVGQAVRFSTVPGGTLPAPLNAATSYEVIASGYTGAIFKVKVSGGAAVTLTDVGNGVVTVTGDVLTLAGDAAISSGDTLVYQPTYSVLARLQCNKNNIESISCNYSDYAVRDWSVYSYGERGYNYLTTEVVEDTTSGLRSAAYITSWTQNPKMAHVNTRVLATNTATFAGVTLPAYYATIDQYGWYTAVGPSQSVSIYNSAIGATADLAINTILGVYINPATARLFNINNGQFTLSAAGVANFTGDVTVASLNAHAPGAVGLDVLASVTIDDALEAQGIETPAPVDRGMSLHVWASNRTDGDAGTGTPEDPFDVSDGTGATSAADLLSLVGTVADNTIIYLYPGTYSVLDASPLSGVAGTGVKLIRWPGANVTWQTPGGASQLADEAAELNLAIAYGTAT